jgi:hypothetical protein
LALPLGVVVLWSNYGSLITTGNDRIILRNNIVRLRWIALILCIILVDLGLRILGHCSLVRSCGVIVVPLARRGILNTVNTLKHEITDHLRRNQT